jgi:hypothetical protein
MHHSVAPSQRSVFGDPDLSDDRELFDSLSKGGNVDLHDIGRVSLLALMMEEAGNNEATTKRGLAFSSPYYYDNACNAFALVTRNDDNQWSSFVYWIVMSTFFFAEENYINAATSDSMPIAILFGESFRHMFRHCILAVGNYGDIYERTLFYITRSGQNLLNLNNVPQQFPVPFM